MVSWDNLLNLIIAFMAILTYIKLNDKNKKQPPSSAKVGRLFYFNTCRGLCMLHRPFLYRKTIIYKSMQLVKTPKQTEGAGKAGQTDTQEQTTGKKTEGRQGRQDGQP